MTSEGLGEMFEGDSADMCAGKFLLMLMGGWAEGLTCADPGARTSTGVSGIGVVVYYINLTLFLMMFLTILVLRLLGVVSPPC
jgi:hypothetical protein